MQPDSPTVLTLKTNHGMLHEGGVFSRQMANPVLGHHHRHRVLIVGIVRFRPQHSNDIHPDPIRSAWALADNVPQRILMTGFADYLKGFPTAEHKNLGLVGRKGGSRCQIPNCIHRSPP
jgi:hypothetical protein